MRISYKNKFIMLSPQKTAGNSIFDAIRDHVDVVHKAVGSIDGKIEASPYYQHVTLERLKMHFETTNHAWNDFYKFCFVRNPWDRYVSWYSFMQSRHGDLIQTNKMITEHGGCVPLKELSFEDYMSRLYIQMHHTINCDNNWYQYPLSSYYMDGDNMIDYVGRVETIDRDLQNICEHLNIQHHPLGIHNKTEHMHYRQYYNNKTREMVEEMEQDCIQRFDYTF